MPSCGCSKPAEHPPLEGHVTPKDRLDKKMEGACSSTAPSRLTIFNSSFIQLAKQIQLILKNSKTKVPGQVYIWTLHVSAKTASDNMSSNKNHGVLEHVID